MMLVRNLLLIVSLILISVRLEAQQPELMVNFETYPNVGMLGSTFEYNGKLYLQKMDTATGNELWVLESGSSTPQLFMDIEPGPEPSFPYGFTVSNGLLFFVAKTSTHGRELWKTDGTVAGTEMVKDLNPGAEDSSPSSLTPFPSVLFGPDDRVAFSATTPGMGREFCISDGTSAGTSCVDINPGVADSSPTDFLRIGLAVVFAADDGTHGKEPWIHSIVTGTPQIIKDIFPGPFSSHPREFAVFDSVGGLRLLFSANDGVHGSEPWTSQGSAANTDMIMDINPGSASTIPRDFKPLSSTQVLFQASGPGTGVELWSTDGLPMSASTSLVKDILPGTQGSVPSDITLFGGVAYFNAYTLAEGRELWRSDGTPAGTFLVEDINPGEEDSRPTLFKVVGADLLFRAETQTYGHELFRTDGTAAGTVQIADIRSGEPGSMPRSLVEFGGKLHFVADGDFESALYFLNATNTGIENVIPLPGIGDKDGNIQEVFPLTEDLLFVSRDDAYLGEEPWYVNVNTKENNVLADISPGLSSSFADYIGRLGEKVFFAARTETQGYELWVTDGTQTGTQLFLDISPGADSSGPRMISADGVELVYNGRLFFSASTTTEGRELWSTDGTVAGTVLVKDINPGAGDSGPLQLYAGLGELYFRASDGTAGAELWKTDGTPSGTVMVKDIYPGALSSNPYRFKEHDGFLFFSATDGANGVELWKTDGTSAGTGMVANLSPSDSYPNDLFSFGSKLLFNALDGVSGRLLYSVDAPYGAANVTLIKDLDPMSNTDSVFGMYDVFGTLLFRGTTAAEGQELWTTDGTPAGTVPFKIINPGPDSGAGSELVQAGNYFYFGANDGVNGYELWRTDGTDLGTMLVADVTPGEVSSSFDFLITHRGALYMLLDTYEYGEELWRVVFDECPDDATKVAPGQCGCGIPDSDSDGDGTLDCAETCPFDGNKLEPGLCGCGVADEDLNFNAIPDCDVNSDIAQVLEDAIGYTKLLGKGKKKLAKMGLSKKALKAKVKELANLLQNYGLSGLSLSEAESTFERNKKKASTRMRQATRLNSKTFKSKKRKALRQLKKVRKMLV